MEEVSTSQISSELNCQQKSTFVIFNNIALQKGGGLHAISSSIMATSAFPWPQLEYTSTKIDLQKIQQRGEVDYHWKQMQNFMS